MCCKGFLKRAVSFALTLAFGLFVANAFQQETVKTQTQKTYCFPKAAKTENGRGRSENRFSEYSPKNETTAPEKKFDSRISSLFISSKPRAIYTEEARANSVQGKVVLRVTFSANGEIGAVVRVTELPDGLTEQAIAAARKIKFEPAKRDGKPVTVVKTIEYSFTIY